MPQNGKVSQLRDLENMIKRWVILFSFAILVSGTIEGNKSGTNDRKFKGICDGSAAVRIHDDMLLVAYDEENTLFLFSSEGGDPLAQADLKELLKLEVTKEMDLEGASRDEKQIWWVGSHGLDKDNHEAPSRRVLFATNIPSPDLEDLKVVEGPFDLYDALLASDKLKKLLTEEVINRGPKEVGLNIEGLSIHRDGGLVLGLRSPLSDPAKHAVAVYLDRKGKDHPFTVRDVMYLHLNRRGIRDMKWSVSNSQYVLIAGPVESGRTHEIFTWDGREAVNKLSDIYLADMNAEAIVEFEDYWLVLSDDGKVKRSDEQAKDGDRKCDKIRKKNSKGANHSSVYFNARSFSY